MEYLKAFGTVCMAILVVAIMAMLLGACSPAEFTVTDDSVKVKSDDIERAREAEARARECGEDGAVITVDPVTDEIVVECGNGA